MQKFEAPLDGSVTKEFCLLYMEFGFIQKYGVTMRSIVHLLVVLLGVLAAVSAKHNLREAQKSPATEVRRHR
jgi:hypothetical protein